MSDAPNQDLPQDLDDDDLDLDDDELDDVEINNDLPNPGEPINAEDPTVGNQLPEDVPSGRDPGKVRGQSAQAPGQNKPKPNQGSSGGPIQR